MVRAYEKTFTREQLALPVRKAALPNRNYTARLEREAAKAKAKAEAEALAIPENAVWCVRASINVEALFIGRIWCTPGHGCVAHGVDAFMFAVNRLHHFVK